MFGSDLGTKKGVSASESASKTKKTKKTNVGCEMQVMGRMWG